MTKVLNISDTAIKPCVCCKTPKNIDCFPTYKGVTKNSCKSCIKDQRIYHYYKSRGRQIPTPIIYADTKTCHNCNTPKELSNFNKCSKTKLNPQGINNCCRDCQKIKQKQKYISVKKPKLIIEFPTRKEKVFKPLSHDPIIGEKWKSVIGYAGKYLISDRGRVFSIKSNGLLKPDFTNKGYLKTVLKGKFHSIHRLVGKHFIQNPDNKPQINHIDGVKTNNYFKNLEWCTHQENQDHAWKTGLMKPNYQNKELNKTKIILREAKIQSKAVAIYNKNMDKVLSFESVLKCAIFLNRSAGTVSNAIKNGYVCNDFYVKVDADFIHPKQKMISKRVRK
jgi:hypothetical protein